MHSVPQTTRGPEVAPPSPSYGPIPPPDYYATLQQQQQQQQQFHLLQQQQELQQRKQQHRRQQLDSPEIITLKDEEEELSQDDIPLAALREARSRIRQPKQQQQQQRQHQTPSGNSIYQQPRHWGSDLGVFPGYPPHAAVGSLLPPPESLLYQPNKQQHQLPPLPKLTQAPAKSRRKAPNPTRLVSNPNAVVGGQQHKQEVHPHPLQRQQQQHLQLPPPNPLLPTPKQQLPYQQQHHLFFQKQQQLQQQSKQQVRQQGNMAATVRMPPRIEAISSLSAVDSMKASRRKLENLKMIMPTIEIDENARSHLFRETKGGYLHGKIYLPREFLNDPRGVYIRLSLAPAAIDFDANPFNLHPNLMHINMKTNKRARKLADGELPDDVDWHFVFKVKDGEVFRMCPPSNSSSNGSSRPKRFHCNPHSAESSDAAKQAEFRIKREFRDKLKKSQNCLEPLGLGLLHLPEGANPTRVVAVGSDGAIDLGNAGLMLNIITPLQKFSKGGTTISDVIRQRFQDLFQREISPESLKEVEDVFTKKKEDRMKLQQVRLLVEVFTCEALAGPAAAAASSFSDVPTAENLHFRTSGLSEVVTNSKSKECGPLQLHDVNPNISCCRSETKIFILSFFKLVADVRANFILYNPGTESIVYDDHEDLMQRVNQPKECAVFNQTAIVFKAPRQDFEVISEISRRGLQLRLSAFRPSDKRMSSNSFEFIYIDHGELAGAAAGRIVSQCAFCTIFRVGQQDAEKLPIAKPGFQRRVANLKQAPAAVLKENETEEERKRRVEEEEEEEEEEEMMVAPPDDEPAPTVLLDPYAPPPNWPGPPAPPALTAAPSTTNFSSPRGPVVPPPPTANPASQPRMPMLKPRPETAPRAPTKQPQPSSSVSPNSTAEQVVQVAQRKRSADEPGRDDDSESASKSRRAEASSSFPAPASMAAAKSPSSSPPQPPPEGTVPIMKITVSQDSGIKMEPMDTPVIVMTESLQGKKSELEAEVKESSEDTAKKQEAKTEVKIKSEEEPESKASSVAASDPKQTPSPSTSSSSSSSHMTVPIPPTKPPPSTKLIASKMVYLKQRDPPTTTNK